MTDNQYNIQIGTTSDSSSVEELAAKIQEATGNADELTNSIEGANSASENLSYTLSNSDGEVFEIVAGGANDAAGALGGVGDAADSAGAGINNIPSDPLKEVGKSSNDAKEGLKGGAESADAMSAALGAIAALGIADLMYTLADAAGAYEESWDRIALLTSGTTDNMGAVEAKWNPAINSMKEATGRGAGVIRGHIQAMSIAGVKDVTAITSAFEGLAGRSYATGIPLEQMEKGLQRAVQVATISSRTLMNLGISEEELSNTKWKNVQNLGAAWKTMTADQRAATIAQILNNKMAKESNESYMESWSYVKEQAGLAWDYLTRVVGAAVLPILIPAIETLTGWIKQLGDWFKSLDGPTQSLIGFIIVLGGILTIAAGIIITVAAAVSVLNLALLANPIVLIVLAVIALIAVLAYLYYSNETVRNGINWLFNGLKILGGYIMGGLILAWNALTGLITGIGPALTQIIIRVIMFGLMFHARVIGIFLGVVNKARAYISQLPGIVWNEMINIGKKIAGAAGYIFSQVQAVFGNIVKWAMQALGIASPGHIARAVFGEMDYLVAGIMGAQSGANAAASGLGDAILDGFGSPSLSVGASINPGTASLGFDATEINASLDNNQDANSSKKIIQNNYINQEGIMGPKEAADFAVKAVTDKLEEENLITGKSG
jgi:hypothetical protein